MCYYITINIAKKDSIKIKSFDIPTNNATVIKPLQNGFSYAPWPIIKSTNSQLQLVEAHWEFIASWNKDWDAVKETRKKFTTLNAKGETIFTSKLYQQAAANTRCLVLVSGFFEWRDLLLPTAKKPVKVPYFISLPEKEYFFMAGIYNPWLDHETGECIDTFAIVTTAANHLMAQIHNSQKRMPVILNDDDALTWLQSTNTKQIEQLAVRQYNPAQMQAYTIERDFRTMANPTAIAEYDVVPDLIFE